MRYTTGQQPKAWAWSYSKVKNYRTCPKRYYEIDVAKNFVEPKGPALDYGDRVHKAWQARIAKGTPFPDDPEEFPEDWEVAAQRLCAAPGKIMTEQQLAIKEDLSPCTWFDKQTWFRAIADYLVVNGPVAMAIDYKTGKVVEDSEQLALMAETIFSHYPEVQAVRTEFWWLKDDAATRRDYQRKNRHQTWAGIMPDVMTLKQAHETMTFPPKPSGLCRRFCAVTSCPYHGKGGNG